MKQTDARQTATYSGRLFSKEVGTASAAINYSTTHILDLADWGFTWVRSFQLFCSLTLADGGVIDMDDNPASIFNKLVHQHGETNMPLAVAGWSMIGVMGGSVVAGGLRGIYQQHRRLRLNSYDYLMNRLKEVDHIVNLNQGSVADIDKVRATGGQLLAERIDGGARYEMDCENSTQIKLKRKEQKILDQEFEELYKPIPVVNTAYQPNILFRTVNRIRDSKAGNVAGYVWGWATNHSMLFWIAWMPVAVAVGAAATFTLPYISVIAGVTLGIGGLMTAWKVVEMARHYFKENKVKKDIKARLGGIKLEDSELSSLIDTIKEKEIPYAHLSGIYKPDKRDLRDKIKIAELPAKVKIKVIYKVISDFKKYDLQQKRKVHTHLKQRVFMKYEHTAWMNKFDPDKKYNQQVKTQADLKSKLTKHLAGSSIERSMRLTVGVFNRALLASVFPMFIFWFLAGVVTVPVLMGAVALKGAAAMIGGPAMFTYTGAVSGGWFGLQALATRRAQQLAYDEKVNSILQSVYKNEEGVTKLSKFAELETAVNAKKQKILSDDQYNQKAKEYNYPVKQIDVYNDYYFEKQKITPTAKSKFKKFMSRAYQFTGGTQTGALIVRGLFLSGCLLAGVVASAGVGAPLLFAGIALGMAVLAGTSKLTQYILDKKQARREFFIDTIDARISYLEMKDEELGAFMSQVDREGHPSQTTRQPTDSASNSTSVSLAAVPGQKSSRSGSFGCGMFQPAPGEQDADSEQNSPRKRSYSC